MKKIGIESSLKNTLRLVGAGVGERASASSPFGPLKVGLIIMPSTRREVPLTELLNCLERKIVDLNTKSYEVLNIFLSDTTHLAEPISSSLSTATTK